MAGTADEIAADLRGRIQRGELQPGAKLPTMDKLAEGWAVNRQTARQALNQLKAEGVMKAIYRRAAGPGVYLILEGVSLDQVRDRLDSLPFVLEGLMTLEYEEIYEI